MTDKIIRSLCYFISQPSSQIVDRIEELTGILVDHDFTIQTKRICTNDNSIKKLDSIFRNTDLYQSVGTIDRQEAKKQFDDFLKAKNVSFNLDISANQTIEDVKFLKEMIKLSPQKTFLFAYTFTNTLSSPYFPSAFYNKDGFAIGLQSTNLSANCNSLNDWFYHMKTTWNEIIELFKNESDFLGIDSSVAPLFYGDSSFIHFIKKITGSFPQSVTTDIYLQISNFIKKQNPKSVGLCGLMFPCLEDFELAKEYENGNFSIERNLYLSLHSGLGIDTYPIGIDEKPARILEILRLLGQFSKKYNKPLSARFISDGKARIDDKSDFKNQYLKDVIIRPL